MKVSFCQTYSDRRDLLKIKFNDKRLLEFYSNFDINIFSFHNSPDEVVQWFKENNNIPNVKIFNNKDVSYTQCIKRLKDTLKALKATHFFFHQDDTFSFNNQEVDLNEFFNYVTAKKSLMLSLDATDKLFDNPVIETELKSFKVYKSNTAEFLKAGRWSFDDSPYICTVNYLDVIYDKQYLSFNDVWNSEHYLNSKFSNTIISRYFTNFRLFKNYNILGENTDNKKQEFIWLKERGLYNECNN